MLNIGGGELLIILLVALIFLGPSRLPDVARQVGQTVGTLRGLARGFQAELEAAARPDALTGPGASTGTNTAELAEKARVDQDPLGETRPVSPGGPEDLTDDGNETDAFRRGRMTTRDAGVSAGQMSLMEHLEELRTRIIRSVIAIAIGAVIAYIFYPPILDFLLEPHCEINPDQCDLLAVSPLEGFSVRLTVAGYTGIGLAMPIVLWQVWQFIAPGLYPHEKRYASRS